MNKEIVRRWILEGFAAGNVDLADELIAEDFTNHTPQPGQQPGRAGLKQAVLGLRGSFADLDVSIHDMLADDDLVAVRDVVRGTHVGPFAGVPPTGKHVEVSRLAFYRLCAGQIAEHWAQLDTLGLLQQLGAAPGEPAAPADAVTGCDGPAAANKALIRRFFEEGLSVGNMLVVDELVAPDLRLHGGPPGREGLKALLGMFRSAFSDYRDTLDELVAEGDRVAARWTFRGTHSGSFQSIAATGRQVQVGGMSVFRIEEGRIIDDWTQIDLVGLMRQINS